MILVYFRHFLKILSVFLLFIIGLGSRFFSREFCGTIWFPMSQNHNVIVYMSVCSNALNNDNVVTVACHLLSVLLLLCGTNVIDMKKIVKCSLHDGKSD